jgi:polyisoprenoid-binding protein YceI
MRTQIKIFALVGLAAFASSALAAPVTYDVDPEHTFPSFAADHFGGMSVWRGKFNSTKGTVVVDKTAGTGTVDVTIDTSSIDTGNDKLNTDLKSANFFDVSKSTSATYKGKLIKFKDGAPTEVQGELTVHGVTKPVTLKINSFKCMTHPMKKKEFCGADASATINREDFGMGWGKSFGFAMEVKLAIQIEAYAQG